MQVSLKDAYAINSIRKALNRADTYRNNNGMSPKVMAKLMGMAKAKAEREG